VRQHDIMTRQKCTFHIALTVSYVERKDLPKYSCSFILVLSVQHLRPADALTGGATKTGPPASDPPRCFASSVQHDITVEYYLGLGQQPDAGLELQVHTECWQTAPNLCCIAHH
jgi:hypothetical protein